MIRNCAISKANVHGRDKVIASRNLGEALRKAYRRKLLQHYTHLRRQTHGSKSVGDQRKAMFGHFFAGMMRDAFGRWKSQAKLSRTVIDGNHIGPVI